MVIEALVVDDEPPVRDELAFLLSRAGGVECRQAGTASEALAMICDHAPDVVFQDILMPGRDGFFVLEQTLSLPRPPLFVFVTAYDHHAIQAFEEGAVDYLMKPVTQERLNKSLERVRRRLQDQDEAAGRQALEHLLAGLGRGPVLPRLPVLDSGRIRLVATREVVLCEAEEKRVVALTDQGRLPCHGLPTLGRVEERLSGWPFLRVSRGVLVNLERVAECTPWFGGRYLLVMDDPSRTEVAASRNRSGELKRRLGI